MVEAGESKVRYLIEVDMVAILRTKGIRCDPQTFLYAGATDAW